MLRDRILAGLLARGYFPKELPPTFTTQDLGREANAIIRDWRVSGVFSEKPTGKVPGTSSKKSNSYIYEFDSADTEIISKPKRGYERRNLHITHPVPQALLCLEIARNWKPIQKWLTRQIYSVDKIRFLASSERSLKPINFAVHSAKNSYLTATSDWLVATDISRFYPSIYTHSIAWAAYGKEKVKANMRLFNGSLADRLDQLLRKCNRDQTMGIPVGPESSRIVAEIISSRIDDDFSSHIPGLRNDQINRMQDDWFIGVGSLEDAETALSKLSEIYRSYGLEINGSKTSIDHIVSIADEPWLSEMSAFLAHGSGSIGSRKLMSFMSLSLRLQRDHPFSHVIPYALSVIEDQIESVSDVDLLESFLLKATLISPISMDRICRIILNLQYKNHEVSRRRIGKRFKVLAERSLTNGNLFELIWILYTFRGLKLPLKSKTISDGVEALNSSAVSLILLDMQDKGLFYGRLPIQQWSAKITADSVRTDWIWLLAYEGIRRGWIPDTNSVMSCPFFDALNSRDVTFYDPRRNIPKSQSVVRRRKRIRNAQVEFAHKFILRLRGFNLIDY